MSSFVSRWRIASQPRASIPDNVAPAGRHAATRHVEPPLIRKLFAYTRSEWSPLATTFVDALQRLRWQTKPDGATVIP
jgi:hypothetical protein